MSGMQNLNRLAQALLGRNQGPEFFASTTHTGAVSQVLIPKNLTLARPLEALIFRWRGRVVIGGANYSAVAAEAPATIINRIIVQGTYKGAQLTPISLSGATAYAWARMFNIRGSSTYIGGTRQAEPSVPYQQVGATFGNTGTYDLDIFYFIPMWPIIARANRAMNVVPYFWTAADWGDSVEIRLELGDLTSFGTPAAMTTVAFTAFGSGAGSPEVSIWPRYVILSDLRDGYQSAAVVRNENTITSGVTALAQNVRLMPLTKQKTTNVVIKSGITLAGTTSGVSVFASLSDIMLDRTQIINDNRPVRNNLSNLVAKESIGLQNSTIVPGGYLPFSFIDSQSVRTAYRADLASVVSPAADFALYSDIIAANAANQVNVVQEMIFANPADPYWGGTK